MNICLNRFAKDPAGAMNEAFQSLCDSPPVGEGLMPNKVAELCNAIKAVQKVVGEVFSGNPGISTTNFHRKVNVDSFSDLEQVEGEAKIEPFNYGETYQWKASKTYEEVEFYTLLTQEQYEAAKAG